MFSFLIFSFGCDKPRETSSLEGNWKTGPSKSIPYQPRKVLDGSGYGWVMSAVKPWPQDSTLEQIGEQFRIAVRSSIASLDQILSDPNLS
ncbi:MAG: hypothetical protein ACK42H_14595, partial [Planctomycetota bacterium]